MQLISSISLSITKKLVVNDTFENKTFYFEPGLVVDVPDEVAQIILDNPFNKQYIKIAPDKSEVPPDGPVFGKEEIPELKVIQDPPLPEEEISEEVKPEEEEKKSEGKPLFTEEDLLKVSKDDLVSIAREMGIKTATAQWKTETLIQKILDVKVPDIE